MFADYYYYFCANGVRSIRSASTIALFTISRARKTCNPKSNKMMETGTHRTYNVKKSNREYTAKNKTIITCCVDTHNTLLFFFWTKERLVFVEDHFSVSRSYIAIVTERLQRMIEILNAIYVCFRGNVFYECILKIWNGIKVECV